MFLASNHLRIPSLKLNLFLSAPNGCLQYFRGESGTITSFNYGEGPNTALSASLVTGTRQLANTNYGICIRMEAGFCAIQYAQVNKTHIIKAQIEAKRHCVAIYISYDLNYNLHKFLARYNVTRGVLNNSAK
jgi:hypothetical protein